MREILGKAKTIRELLNGTKYTVDYYQREYKWGTPQIRELVDDLTSRFLQDYEPQHERQAVANYGHYFLGSSQTAIFCGYVANTRRHMRYISCNCRGQALLYLRFIDRLVGDCLSLSDKGGGHFLTVKSRVN